MWRPDGWEKPISIISPQCSEVVMGIPEHEMIYEAGADAMLEALFKMAQESPTGTFTIDSHTVNIQILS